MPHTNVSRVRSLAHIHVASASLPLLASNGMLAGCAHTQGIHTHRSSDPALLLFSLFVYLFAFYLIRSYLFSIFLIHYMLYFASFILFVKFLPFPSLLLLLLPSSSSLRCFSTLVAHNNSYFLVFYYVFMVQESVILAWPFHMKYSRERTRTHACTHTNRIKCQMYAELLCERNPVRRLINTRRRSARRCMRFERRKHTTSHFDLLVLSSFLFPFAQLFHYVNNPKFTSEWWRRSARSEREKFDHILESYSSVMGSRIIICHNFRSSLGRF